MGGLRNRETFRFVPALPSFGFTLGDLRSKRVFTRQPSRTRSTPFFSSLPLLLALEGSAIRRPTVFGVVPSVFRNLNVLEPAPLQAGDLLYLVPFLDVLEQNAGQYLRYPLQ